MNKTQNYYNQNHKALIERYNSATLTNLNQLFNKYIEDDYFKDRIFLGQLPNLNLDIDFKFDVIVLVAILMHLSKDEIVDSIESIKRYLVDGGVVIVNYSVTPREDDEKHIYLFKESIEFFREI